VLAAATDIYCGRGATVAVRPFTSSQLGIADPAPTPSGPIAGPSRDYATRASRRLDPNMAPPFASTALGAGHASLTADAPRSLAGSDNPDHSFISPIVFKDIGVDPGFNPLGRVSAVRELPTYLIADLMRSIIAGSSTALGDVDASSLVLWKPLEPLPLDVGGEIPALSQLLEGLRKDPKSVAQKLAPGIRVVKYFDNESLRDGHLHLIVQAPIFRDGETTGAKKRKRDIAGDIADFRDGED